MQIEQNEGLWLHQHYELSLAELAELSGVREAVLRDWVDEGVLVPTNPDSAQWTFGANRLVTIQLASRLGKDLELESHGLALVVSLLERIHALEDEVHQLRARLPHVLR